MSKLFGKCKLFKIVSFDIFDTLLKRDVFLPKDVFYLVEKQYNSMQEDCKSGYAEKRRLAEKRARAESKYDEVTLDEIYDVIDFPEAEKRILKEIELNVESAILHRNPDILSLYKKCIDAGKLVYIVSDMYLPLNFLEKILIREGIKDYKKIFLSCDYRKTKRSGSLFKALCEEENISPKDMIHIGDSRYADFIGPRRIGIKGIHINRHNCNTLYMDNAIENATISERCLYAFINERTNELNNRDMRLGYEVLGPIIYAYCQWLHQFISQTKNKKKVWFAARDMYLFQEAYDYIFGPDGDSEYIYLSRKSLRPIYSQAVGGIARSGDAFARGKYSLREIVECMGYTISDVAITRGTKLDDKKYDIRELDKYTEVLEALSSPIIQINEKCLSEMGDKYLSEHGLYDQDIILADVGWHGTTQYILQKIQSQKSNSVSVHGMYVGCLDGTREKIGVDNYEVLIFDEEDDCWFKKGTTLFEALISAPHGSTKQYQLNGDRIVPVLSEREELTTFITNVQQGAMAFVHDFSKSILSKEIYLDKSFVAYAFEKMTCKPHKEELESIGNLDFDNFYSSKMASPKSLLYYIVHFGELTSDLKYSPWRIGFLYRLLKIRFPYAKIYDFVRRKQGKMT